MKKLIEQTKSSLLFAKSNACLLWYTTDDKTGKRVLYLVKKWIFALYAVCTVFYFGNMSGSINLKKLESESGKLIEIAKYLFSTLQTEIRNHPKSPYHCKYFQASIHPFEIQQLALWIFGSISDSQKNCAMHQQFTMHWLLENTTRL